MDKKSRNLELEAWLIETTGEEMMANHLGPNWNRFNEEFGFYPNMAMTVADLVWQHQQAKVEEMQKQINSALEQIEKLYAKAESDYEKECNPYYDGILSALDLAEQAIRGELEEQALKGEG